MKKSPVHCLREFQEVEVLSLSTGRPSRVTPSVTILDMGLTLAGLGCVFCRRWRSEAATQEFPRGAHQDSCFVGGASLAIIMSVALTSAVASSPRFRRSSSKASLVMTAVNFWSPIRRRTCATRPSRRTSSMTPRRRFLPLTSINTPPFRFRL